MRKLLLLLSFLPLSMAQAQTTTIPDASFEATLIFLGLDTGTVNGWVPTNFIDTVTSLNVSVAGISDLTGIEDFAALETLNCYYNVLGSLDVTQNTALTELYCGYNYIGSIDLSQNVNLVKFSGSWGGFSSLDFSSNPLLESMICVENPLTSIDVTQNTALKTLYVGNLLSTLNLSNNVALETLTCTSNNNLVSLDLTHNINLTTVNCDYNQLQCVNIKNGNNTNMVSFVASNNPNLTCIEVDDAAYSTTNWTDIDPVSSFSTFCNNACSTVGVEELTAATVSIAPNPIQGAFTIAFEAPTTGVASLLNALGQVVQKVEFNASNQINVALNEPPGVYVVRLEVEGTILTKKVVKE